MENLGGHQRAMSCLNERLKSFVQYVSDLHEANGQLERQIVEWSRKNTAKPHDWTEQEQTTQELRSQVTEMVIENAQLAFLLDEMKSKASHFKTRHAAVERLTGSLQQQVSLLGRRKTEIEQANTQLECELLAAKVDLQQMHKDQEEDVCRHGQAAVREAQVELAHARRHWLTLQMDIESLHVLERGLQGSLCQTEQQYSSLLHDLSSEAQRLELELHEIHDNLANQQQSHNHLLNTKLKLESEVAAYKMIIERLGIRNEVWFGPQRMAQVLSPRCLQGAATATQQDGDQPLCAGSKLCTTSPVVQRQTMQVIFTEPGLGREVEIATVKTQEILKGKVVQESAEGQCTVNTEKIDAVIKKWESVFLSENPKVKKSSSLRFDLHMAPAGETSRQNQQDSQPRIELCLVMRCSQGSLTMPQ